MIAGSTMMNGGPPEAFFESRGVVERVERSAAPPSTGRTLGFIRASSLDGCALPERRWLVPGWIPDRAVTLLGGDGGVGKSLLALQLMVACATARPWLGLPARQCRAFGLFCEDDAAEVHLRADAVARHHRVKFRDLDGVAWSARAGRPNVLMTFSNDGAGRPTPLWDGLVDAVQKVGAQVVVIDTLADVFGGQENFRSQARAFINLLRDLALRIDGAVVLTAHPSVAGQQSGTGLSGSTAWNNSVRSRLYLTRSDEQDADRNERVLKRLKANYAGTGDKIRMTYMDGVLVSETHGGEMGRLARRAHAESAFMDALTAYAQQGGTVSPNVSSIYAPTVLAKFASCAGIGRKELADAMSRLIEKGRLRIEETGPQSKRRSRLVIEAPTCPE